MTTRFYRFSELQDPPASFETGSEERTILSLNRDRVAFEIVPSKVSKASGMVLHAIASNIMAKDYTYFPDENDSIDCYHLFNSIPLTNLPFVCTFETLLPRWHGSQAEFWQIGYETLASDRCRRLFAMSENSANIMNSHLRTIAGEQAAVTFCKSLLSGATTASGRDSEIGRTLSARPAPSLPLPRSSNGSKRETEHTRRVSARRPLPRSSRGRSF